MTDDRKQWRGKVRVSERRNALGEVEYMAEYRRRWYLDWSYVESGPPEYLKGYGYVANHTFPTLDAARIAGQLKWNAETAEHADSLKRRFSAWRKVWP